MAFLDSRKGNKGAFCQYQQKHNKTMFAQTMKVGRWGWDQPQENITEPLPYSHCEDPTARQRQDWALNNSLVMSAIRATLCLLLCVFFRVFLSPWHFLLWGNSLDPLPSLSSRPAWCKAICCWRPYPGVGNTHTLSGFPRYFYQGVYGNRTILSFGLRIKKKASSLLGPLAFCFLKIAQAGISHFFKEL